MDSSLLIYGVLDEKNEPYCGDTFQTLAGPGHFPSGTFNSLVFSSRLLVPVHRMLLLYLVFIPSFIPVS